MKDHIRRIPSITAFIMIGAVSLYLIGLWAETPEPAEPSPALPIGAIIAFGGPPSAVPENQGWLLCDGRELSVEAYGELHKAIQYAWGRGPASGTFRIPDLRGRFLRGVDLSPEGRDPDRDARQASFSGGNSGNQVGSLQEDTLRFHSHPVSGASRAAGVGAPGSGVLRFYGVPIEADNAPPVIDQTSVLGAGESETRPKNAAVHWIIRAR